MQTIVLKGTGPHIRMRVTDKNSRITVINKSKSKTFNLPKNSEVTYAA